MGHHFSRRHFLKGTAVTIGALAVSSLPLAHPVLAAPQNPLVVYFSWSGNTRGIARLLQQKVGGEIVELELATPYSRDYNTCLEQAKSDQQNGARPALKTHVADMARHDVIFLGYPNWWGTIPMPVASFLEQHGCLAEKNRHGAMSKTTCIFSDRRNGHEEKYRFRIGFIPHTVGSGRSGGGWKGELGAGWAFGHHGA